MADPPVAEAAPRGRLDAGSWFALFIFGLFLFLLGVLLGLAASGDLPLRLGGSVLFHYLPFALTVPGGALAVYAYEEYHRLDARARAHRKPLESLPSFEHYIPPGGRARK